jgi:hypothetical protein
MIKIILSSKLSFSALFSMIVSSTRRESNPIYEGATRLEDGTRDIFSQHRWQPNLQIGPPSS